MATTFFRNTSIALFVAVCTVFVGTSVASAASARNSASIVDIVLKEDGEFDILQAAVMRAGYVDLLNGSRQFTVFAPTDAAFIKTLGATSEQGALSTVASLPVKDLQTILSYHVMAGRHSTTSVLARQSYNTLGNRLPKSELLSAGIAATDIQARNGVVHIINSVLLP